MKSETASGSVTGTRADVTRIHADTDALKEFHGALTRFRSAQLDMVDRVDTEIEMARVSLEAKASRWRARLERSRAELDECRHRSGASDSPADCSESARLVSEAEQQLELIQQWQYRIDEQASEFRDAGGRFRNLLENDLPHAEAELLAAIASLEGARRVQGDSS